MPIVAEFDGIRIMFYANEHPPPHFHAYCAEHVASFDIATLSVIEGFLPVVKRRKVIRWAATRQDALLEAFLRTTSHEKVERIP